jgi:hypothetical protein
LTFLTLDLQTETVYSVYFTHIFIKKDLRAMKSGILLFFLFITTTTQGMQSKNIYEEQRALIRALNTTKKKLKKASYTGDTLLMRKCKNSLQCIQLFLRQIETITTQNLPPEQIKQKFENYLVLKQSYLITLRSK